MRNKRPTEPPPSPPPPPPPHMPTGGIQPPPVRREHIINGDLTSVAKISAKLDAASKRRPTRTWPAAILLVALVSGLALAGWIGLSYMEARAYERLTGRQVSTFDAMFVQLRVMGE